MSASPGPARRRLAARPAERDLGPRAPRRRAAAGAGPAVGVEPARRIEPPAQPVHRPAPPDDDRGRRRGLRLQPRLLGQLPGRGGGRPASGRPGSGSGIDPEGFAWRLEPGAEFVTPEAVLAYSADGLGELERRLPQPVPRAPRARSLARPAATGRSSTTGRATYFDFDEPKLIDMATAARDLGIELFVLDDGWFGARDDDTSSLGDWFVDRRKLPNGVDGLARKIEALGLRFGLWIEPEMVSQREPAVRGAPRLGDRRPGPAANREPPAARARHVAPGGRRLPVRGPVGRARERPRVVRQVGHEPEHHRAVQRGPPAPTARASSSTATSSASTSSTGD